MDPQATAGRIVHYYPLDAETPADVRAAIVNTHTLEDGTAELTVFSRGGPLVVGRVQYSEDPQPGYWSWMPYQKAKADTAEGNQSESAEPRPKEVSDDNPSTPETAEEEEVTPDAES